MAGESLYSQYRMKAELYSSQTFNFLSIPAEWWSDYINTPSYRYVASFSRFDATSVIIDSLASTTSFYLVLYCTASSTCVFNGQVDVQVIPWPPFEDTTPARINDACEAFGLVCDEKPSFRDQDYAAANTLPWFMWLLIVVGSIVFITITALFIAAVVRHVRRRRQVEPYTALKVPTDANEQEAVTQ